MMRVEQSHNITLANLLGDVRVGPVSASGFGGLGVDPRNWTFVTWSNGTTPESDTDVLASLDRPPVFVLH